ncbi:MAG TPA: cyclic nucleotide-binding domain-containing protein, partial [Gemmatimonadales bacterium]|nr:cyclic nucleotide-binding domain-containing protein [Gemmatimonadales bacterium]
MEPISDSNLSTDPGATPSPDTQPNAAPPTRASTAAGENEPTGRRAVSDPGATMAASPLGRAVAEGKPRPAPPVDPAVDAEDQELTRAFDGPFGRMEPHDAARGMQVVLPLFEELPADAHAEIVRRMIIRRVGAGTLIVREGDPGDACYVISLGSVRVLKRTADGRRLVEVARLAEGSLFGEFALLADRRRHASVEATTEVELFEIPRRLLEEIAVEYPGVGSALNRFYRERLLGSLVATASFFRALPRDERAGLAARFHTRHVEGGEVIIHEGSQGGGFFL